MAIRRAVVIAGDRIEDDLRPVVRTLDFHVSVIQVSDPGAVGQDFIKVDVGKDAAALGRGRKHLQQPVVIQIGNGIIPIWSVFALVKGPKTAVRLQNVPLLFDRERRLGRGCRRGMQSFRDRLQVKAVQILCRDADRIGDPFGRVIYAVLITI